MLNLTFLDVSGVSFIHVVPNENREGCENRSICSDVEESQYLDIPMKCQASSRVGPGQVIPVYC